MIATRIDPILRWQCVRLHLQLLEPSHQDHANNTIICSQKNLDADIAMQ